MLEQRCIFCGGDPTEPNHWEFCDGRQGGRVEEIPTPLLDLADAKAARNDALAEVEINAAEAFYETAQLTIALVARVRPTFIIDDVWAARSSWPATHDRRAMGAAMLQAKRDGLIMPTDDFRLTAQVLRHAAPVRVWRSLVCNVA